MTTHIDTLRDWWNDAERGVAHEGDTVIYHDGADDMYQVYTLGTGQVSEWRFIRILHRAPKPKPAWHDAEAVLASTSDFGLRRVFVKDVDGIWNDALTGRGSVEGSLRDVTPLIEAKVTDGMARTVLNDYYEMDDVGHNWPADTVTLMRLAITAALGLETE